MKKVILHLKSKAKRKLHWVSERIRKYCSLAVEYIRLKSAHKITRKQFEIGKEELELAKKKAKKEYGRIFVEEFEKMSREKHRQMKPMPEKAMQMRVHFMKRIKENILKLFHPIRTLRETRKTKIIISENKRGKIRL